MPEFKPSVFRGKLRIVASPNQRVEYEKLQAWFQNVEIVFRGVIPPPLEGCGYAYVLPFEVDDKDGSI